MKPLYHIIMNNTTKIATIQNRDDAYNLCEILRCCQRVYSKIKTKDKPYILRYEFCVVQSPNRDDDRIYRMSAVTRNSPFAKIVDEEIDYFIEYNGCYPFERESY